MGQRAKAKDKPAPIYRSRQAGRTDIEELLGPAFNPHQRLTVDAEKVAPLPCPGSDLDQYGPPLSSLDETSPLSTVASAPEESQAAEAELKNPPALLGNSSVSDPLTDAAFLTDTIVTDSVDSGIASNLDDSFAIQIKELDPLSTVDNDSMPTVGTGDAIDLDLYPLGTVDSDLQASHPEEHTLTRSSPVKKPLTSVPSDYGFETRWITEQGQIVSEKQVRPFKIAQEVLNSNERILYTVLWNHKEAKIDPHDPHTRTVRAGYDLLAKQTNLAKKTIQRLIPRLMQKDFIRLHETPDFYNRVAASYQVFSYKRVLEIAAEQGRTHVANLGHGIAFVRNCLHTRSVENPESLGTVVSAPQSTVPTQPTVSVPSPPPPTVVRKSTF